MKYKAHLYSLSSSLPSPKQNVKKCKLFYSCCSSYWKNDLLEQSGDQINPMNLFLKKMCLLEKERIASLFFEGVDLRKLGFIWKEFCEFVSTNLREMLVNKCLEGL